MYIKSKNEIKANCIHCGEKRVMAYWDDELEYYIYLADEPPVCTKCIDKSTINIQQKAKNTAKSKIQQKA